jgi:hypothetical protein
VRGSGFRWPWRRRADIARSVDDELEFHLAARIVELERSGVPPAEARRQAIREFGDLEGTRRYCVATDWEGERAMRRTEIWDELRQDVVHSVRTIRKQPGFALAVTATLALGIGATTVVFALIRSVLLSPLPYRAPAELVAMSQFVPTDPRIWSGSMSPPNYLDLRASVPALSEAGALAEGEVTLTGQGTPERLRAPAVTPSLFGAL